MIVKIISLVTVVQADNVFTYPIKLGAHAFMHSGRCVLMVSLCGMGTNSPLCMHSAAPQSLHREGKHNNSHLTNRILLHHRMNSTALQFVLFIYLDNC